MKYLGTVTDKLERLTEMSTLARIMVELAESNRGLARSEDAPQVQIESERGYVLDQL